MSDQCQHCMHRGCLSGCEATPCAQHKNWYPTVLKKYANELEGNCKDLRNVIRRLENKVVDLEMKKGTENHLTELRDFIKDELVTYNYGRECVDIKKDITMEQLFELGNLVHKVLLQKNGLMETV